MSLSEIDTETQPYDDLVTALNSVPQSVPLSIEILLDSHPLLPGQIISVIEGIIFIPRKSLKKAFLTARSRFFSLLKNPDEYLAVLDATTVILLTDPEFLTAANARKRIILHFDKLNASEARDQLIAKDLWFVQGLLNSTLRRHTKSPTLWSHRRWLLHLQNDVKDQDEITTVALIAAQNHPRNYYAWDFVRWWITSHSDIMQTFETHTTRQEKLTENDLNMPPLIAFFLDWCLKHPSDTSGWSFLMWLLIEYANNTKTTEGAIGTNQPRSLFSIVGKQVLQRTKMLRLRNESLWVFLRTLITEQEVSTDLQESYSREIRDLGVKKPA